MNEFDDWNDDGDLTCGMSYSGIDEIVNYFHSLSSSQVDFFVDAMRDNEASNGVIFTGDECLKIGQAIMQIMTDPTTYDKSPTFYFNLGVLKTALSSCYQGMVMFQ